MSFKEYRVEWVAFKESTLEFRFLFLADWISMVFFSTVMLIAGSVILYRRSYIQEDGFRSRFGLLVISFVLRISLLIFSPNLIRVLLGWDGLGVTSYLLVAYYSREKRFNARILTALTNRLGDVAILILIALWSAHGVFNYGLMSCARRQEIILAGGIIVLAAITKRAQVPFSSWLPAAMAAPTPVSALVHSSTLVTAGVYVLIRMNGVFYSARICEILLWLGLITIFMAGGSAIYEVDIKKVIALSTLRQLGVMFFSLGMGLPIFTFIHLISHAYFKAMLFIAAGAIIHRLKEFQDLRKIGRRVSSHPALAGVILTRNLSLCGFPFLSGFYSKDLILEILLINTNNLWVLAGAIFATALTVAYSVRLTLGIMIKPRRREVFRAEGDIDLVIAFRIRFLFLPSIIGGWWLMGLESFSFHVYLPLWIKTLIFIIVSRVRAALILTPLILVRRNQFTQGFHQIWFLPLTLSPFWTSITLQSASNINKIRDKRWTETLVWKAIINAILPLYNMFLFQQLILSGIAVILFLVVVN